MTTTTTPSMIVVHESITRRVVCDPIMARDDDDSFWRLDFVEVEIVPDGFCYGTAWARKCSKRTGRPTDKARPQPVFMSGFREIVAAAVDVAKGNLPQAPKPTPVPSLVGTKTTATINRRTLGTFVEQAVNLLARNSSEVYEIDMDAHTTRTGMTRAEISVGGGMGALLALSNVDTKMEG